MLPNLRYLSYGLKSAGPFDGFPKNVAYVGQSIAVSGANSSDLSYFSNIVCAPKSLSISYNRYLSSLSGLNIWPAGDLQNLVVEYNPLLTRAALQPLGLILQCQAGSSPQNSTVTVSVLPDECSNRLASADAFCTYLLNGCPAVG